MLVSGDRRGHQLPLVQDECIDCGSLFKTYDTGILLRMRYEDHTTSIWHWTYWGLNKMTNIKTYQNTVFRQNYLFRAKFQSILLQRVLLTIDQLCLNAWCKATAGANQVPWHHTASLRYNVLLIIGLTVNMIDAISAYIGSINLIYKSHYTPVPYLTVYFSKQFFYDSCIVGYGTFAWWDLLDWSILQTVCYQRLRLCLYW